MKQFLRILLLAAAAFLITVPSASAGDFDWVKDFNLKAEVDPSGFKATLSTRFKIGDVEVKTVLSNTDKPADAYMVMRLSEIANAPVETVLKSYKKSKGKGWGNLAKSLGIKPGSREFHALKAGHDLNFGGDKGKSKKSGKGNGKGGGKGKK